VQTTGTVASADSTASPAPATTAPVAVAPDATTTVAAFTTESIHPWLLTAMERRDELKKRIYELAKTLPTPKPTPHSSGGPSSSKKEEDRFDTLAKRALFGGSVPPPPSPPQLEAILGSQALIQGKWVSVGDKVGEEEVVEITLTKVVLKNPEGNRREMVLSGTHGGPEGAPSPSGDSPSPGSPPPSVSIVQPEGAFVPRPPSGGPGNAMGEIPPSVLKRLTGPGGPLEGKSPEEAQEWIRERRERAVSRRGPRP
jgi:hypothetical protein